MNKKFITRISTHYYDSNNLYTYKDLGSKLKEYIYYAHTNSYQIVFVCIGTDRATGDSLGPLVGHKLTKLLPSDTAILGTLEHPVHAKNLDATIAFINRTYSNPYIIVIDASLGISKHIGYVTLSNTSTCPGKGVNKTLPEIGHLSLTGIVNISNYASTLMLQSTRLYTVMTLADYIVLSIYYAYESS